MERCDNFLDSDVSEPALLEQTRETLRILERKRVWPLRRRKGNTPELPQDVEDDAEPRVPLARAPNGYDRPPTRAKHAHDFASGPPWVRDEHDSHPA